MAEAARPGILMTRPEPAASALAARLRAAGAEVWVSPLMTSRLRAAFVDVEGAAAAVFTSANGVRGAPQGEALRALPCWCVGEATAEAARASGFSRTRAGPSDAAALAGAMLAGGIGPGDRVIHLRGAHGTDGFAEALEAAGVRVDAAEVYAMEPASGLDASALSALREGRISVAPVYSPRSARLLAKALEGLELGGLRAAAISPAAAAPLEGLGLADVAVCAAPDGGAMETLILRLAGLTAAADAARD